MSRLDLQFRMASTGQESHEEGDGRNSEPRSAGDSDSEAEVVFTVYNGEHIVKGPLARKGSDEEQSN